MKENLEYFGCEGDPIAMELVDLGLACTRASKIGDAVAEEDLGKLLSAIGNCDIGNLKLLLKIRPRYIVQAVGYELATWGGKNCPIMESIRHHCGVDFSLDWVREVVKNDPHYVGSTMLGR